MSEIKVAARGVGARGCMSDRSKDGRGDLRQAFLHNARFSVFVLL